MQSKFLKISEIFQSIQGEGTNSGKPAIFLRTALCNLTCDWCDTKYTWDWDNFDYEKEVKEMSIKEIMNQIEKFTIKHLVITGGEPLLQQDELVELLEKLSPNKYYTEMETNCTIKPKKELLPLINQWNVSPKTSNSKNKLELYENSECYNFFSNQENAFFKFVVEKENDITEIKYFVEKYHLPKQKIFLMPQATNKEELAKCKNEIRKLSEKNNFGFSNRMHIELWGSQRGK